MHHGHQGLSFCGGGALKLDLVLPDPDLQGSFEPIFEYVEVQGYFGPDLFG